MHIMNSTLITSIAIEAVDIRHYLLSEKYLKVLKNQLKLDFSICLLDDGLNIPSSISDSIRVIKYVSVVFCWVKTAPKHNQGAVLLMKWLFVFILSQHKWLFVHMSGNKRRIWK